MTPKQKRRLDAILNKMSFEELTRLDSALAAEKERATKRTPEEFKQWWKHDISDTQFAASVDYVVTELKKSEKNE